MRNLLLIGRWHAVTKDQEATLRQQIDQAGPGRLLFVITAADQAGTQRNPLPLQARQEIVRGLASRLGRPHVIQSVPDTLADSQWVEHVEKAVGGGVTVSPETTTVVTSNPDVRDRFTARGYPVLRQEFTGALPADLLGAIVSGEHWQDLANEDTLRVYQERNLEPKVRSIFGDVLLTHEGELSTGRDFRVYAAGMDASMAVKVEDICPYIVSGRIVDKGCGTGKFLVHLSQLFPTTPIVGMDLSRELLRTAESQHYVHQNVSIVMANIIHRRFPPGTVGTVIFSSVMHEIYSYTGYDRESVRVALRTTREELRTGGRVIIRDGVSPGQGRVWMRCDAETERRFRRFAKEFKGKSASPGVPFHERSHAGQIWFVLTLHEANEFLSKKDYLENWAIEVNEEFGVFTLAGWRSELEQTGYRVVEARSYLNPWILEHRYRGQAWLHADAGDRPGPELPFPDTTAMIVGEAV